MNIEQIALEVGITPEQLSQCLAKIGEGLEPVGVFADVNKLTPEHGTRWEQMIPESYDGIEFIHLYATPHEAIIAAEQRVAEACAKVCSSMKSIYLRSEAHSDKEMAFLIASADDCIEAIRSGEWRKHL